jgi:hypothetical protein
MDCGACPKWSKNFYNGLRGKPFFTKKEVGKKSTNYL